MKRGGYLAVAASLLLLAGCAGDQTEPSDRGERSVTETLSEAALRTRNAWGRKPQTYKPLKNYQLDLYPTRREFETGKDAELVFALRNTDRKPVRLEDWHLQQSDNIRLLIQNWFPGTEEPDPEAWIPLNEDPADPDLRYPLDLMPGTQALIPKALPFIRDLEVSPGAERRYFVKAELTLETVKVETGVFGIAVRRGKDE